MQPYQRIDHREVYRNPWVSVEIHGIVHPTGVPGEHVLIRTPRASGVLVIDGDDVIFTEQARFGASRSVVEIAKGGAGEGETPLQCAKRELREELGIEATQWRSLGDVYEIPSIVEGSIALFVATGLTQLATEQEAVERIEPLRMPLRAAIEKVASGEIDDAVTLAALLRYGLRAGQAGGAVFGFH